MIDRLLRRGRYCKHKKAEVVRVWTKPYLGYSHSHVVDICGMVCHDCGRTLVRNLEKCFRPENMSDAMTWLNAKRDPVAKR